MITEPAPVLRAESWWTGARRMWAGWLASRLVTLLILIPEHKVLGDVRYYFVEVDAALRSGSGAGALREYPAPVLAFLALPHLASGHSMQVYEGVFVALMLALDAALAWALFRGGRWHPGVTLWLAMPPLLGPMVLCRFDLLPAVLAAGALLVAPRRPLVAGMLAALGAAVKLWPAAVVPALWLRREGRWRLLTGFGAILAAALGLALALAGVHRLTSPLAWQGERGLQLEAYVALPLLVTGVFRPGTWHVEYTRFFAFQVYGPGTGAALTAATVATGLAVLLLAGLWLRALRLRSALPPGVPGLLATLTVCLVALTDKTLSPQYLIWVAAVLAAAAALHPASTPRAAIPLLLATCALTQLIFPLKYDPLVAIRPYAVLLLVLRDAGLAAVAWLVGRQVWVLTRRPAVAP